MTLKIKNRKLAFLACLLFCLFISLGMWQLRRADDKAALLKSFSQRAHHAPLKTTQLLGPIDIRFYRAQLVGKFDNDHTILLDNKTHQGKIGYEVYTPFHANGITLPILVDRGFIQSTGRKELPAIQAMTEETTIIGMLNFPPRFKALGDMIDGENEKWPLRVEFIDLQKLGEELDTLFLPYILTLDPKHAAAFDLQWEIVTMSPERHQGYALQWFAFALTLLILFAALNLEKK